MKKIWTYSLLIIIGLLSLLSCSTKSNNNQEFKYFIYYLKALGLQIPASEPKYVYLVIPIDICPPCLQRYKKFILNSNNEKIQFILTGNGRKRIALTFGNQIMNKKNVLVDSEGLWYSHNLHNDLAKSFYLKNSLFLKTADIDPNNLASELNEITNFLSDKPNEEQYLDSTDENKMIDGMLNSFEKFSKEQNFTNQRLERFTGLTIDEKTFDTENYKGKVLVINFWIFGCAPCIKEIPELNQVYKDSRNEDFIFVSVCAEPAQRIREMTSKDENGAIIIGQLIDSPIYYPVISNGKDLAVKYNITSYPITLVINKEGIISYVIYYTKSFNDQPLTYKLIKRAIHKASN